MSDPIEPAVGHPRLRDALDQVRPRLAELDRADLSSVNLDPFAAASQVRGALPGLQSLRDDLVETFNRFDVTNLDLLETYALALLQAETVFRAVTAKPEETALLLSEAFTLREGLVADAKVLANRRLLPKARLLNLRVPNGYRNIGVDLLSLSTLLRESWPNISNNTPIQLAELDRAEVLAEQLLCIVTARHRRTVATDAAADDRRRAFTLTVKAYDEVRCAIVYLRRHLGDANRIAPSLYRKRKLGREKTMATALIADDADPEGEPHSNCAPETSDQFQQTKEPRARTKNTNPVVH